MLASNDIDIGFSELAGGVRTVSSENTNGMVCQSLGQPPAPMVAYERGHAIALYSEHFRPTF